MRTGENIYKRKDGRWEARYVKEITANGRKKYASVYGKSYAEAKEKQRLYNRAPKRLTDKQNAVFSAAAAIWLELKKAEVKPSTYIKYEGICRLHLCPALGEIHINDISAFTLANFSRRLADEVSPKTANDILMVLSNILKYTEYEYKTEMPPVNYVRSEAKEMRVLTVQEQQILMCYLNGRDDACSIGVKLALLTGIRLGELCALQWSDITEDSICISKTMLRLRGEDGKSHVLLCPPKSESSLRRIPLPPSLKPALDELRGEGFLLAEAGRAITEPRVMQYKFEQMIAQCGLPKTNFHALRHTFATRCVEAGVDVKTLSEILGHSDVKTTLSRYVHSSFEQKQSSIARMEEYVL